MVSATIQLTNKLGLHARPANLFVKACNIFQSDVYFHFDGKRSNAKSMLAVLSAGVSGGSVLELCCDGVDEQAALSQLTDLLSSLPD